ncbi:MAG: DUF2652 domain-containing protein [Flavobacteriia bacterium]|nr:DUF2652 domain-containing protein [Flavobacteriia bacterium]OIP45285.1 MAG: hypothetical protein AUK46_12565 [Flavobacteriaceae bacterium CG2_30_31_66]PIV98008.1 MAG: hypothetical protein COW43_00230 [Flavobacteriaceae bacterium CG17_big_fil_post_rev_8_21_14_2_50_31_13]PIY14104.1 MAG: hypothetical protein COZ16_10830 [Flavobacteriaceae bacterium CG_4_10_14_3_um_filter_31_253]PIZ10224.1 MAG: hypothetical protein COY55_09410 [Flavobacteriaceae bacterium CG_4_10_14_0_8_um_filter_31_99]PJC09119
MKKALYYMPDISGFTKFVNNTEVEHSIHIIAELLEILLDSTTLDLQLVEIEGDALFMFTTKIPSYEQLMQQITTMLEAFHKHTKNYDKMRICDCGSCKTTTNLELKFLVHYGDLAFIKVKHIKKPYGSDVIKIHRLLKNKIAANEYVLFTNAVFELYKDKLDHSWQKTTENYDLTNLDYFYKNLEIIKDKIQIENTASNSKKLENTLPVLTIEKTFNANIQDVYNYVTELKYRHLWDKEVKRIEYDESKINRIGTEHNCVLKLGNLKFETISTPSSNSLVYGEKTKDMMFTNNYSYLIKLQKKNENTTQITLTIYLDFNTIGTFIKSTILKMVSKMWNYKLEHLHEISKNKIQ